MKNYLYIFLNIILIDLICSINSSNYYYLSPGGFSSKRSPFIPLFKNTRIKFTFKGIGNQIYSCDNNNTWQYLYSETELINRYTGETVGYQHKNYWSFNILTTINQSPLLMNSTRVDTKGRDMNNIFYIKSSNIISGKVPVSSCISSFINSSETYNINIPYSCDYSFYEPEEENDINGPGSNINNPIGVVTKLGNYQNQIFIISNT
jgi:hypothetical protein